MLKVPAKYNRCGIKIKCLRCKWQVSKKCGLTGAEALNTSPNYLSGLLKTLTGQSTQQHIHDKLIEKAKEKLSTTTLSVSEIAYTLGFEHSQSFSKLFKSKTKTSPLEFRHSFN
jgi:AraC-like DNA-binding protein